MQIVWKAFIFKRDTSSFKLISPDTKTVEIRKKPFGNKSLNLAIQQQSKCQNVQYKNFQCQEFQCQQFQQQRKYQILGFLTSTSTALKAHEMLLATRLTKYLVLRLTCKSRSLLQYGTTPLVVFCYFSPCVFSSNVSSKSSGEKKRNYTSAVFRDYTTGPNTLWLGNWGGVDFVRTWYETKRPSYINSFQLLEYGCCVKTA